jgi:hypothetical protein
MGRDDIQRHIVREVAKNAPPARRRWKTPETARAGTSPALFQNDQGGLLLRYMVLTQVLAAFDHSY